MKKRRGAASFKSSLGEGLHLRRRSATSSGDEVDPAGPGASLQGARPGVVGITVKRIRAGPLLTSCPATLLYDAEKKALSDRTAVGRWGDRRNSSGPTRCCKGRRAVYVTGQTNRASWRLMAVEPAPRGGRDSNDVTRIQCASGCPRRLGFRARAVPKKGRLQRRPGDVSRASAEEPWPVAGGNPSQQTTEAHASAGNRGTFINLSQPGNDGRHYVFRCWIRQGLAAPWNEEYPGGAGRAGWAVTASGRR